MCVYLCVCLCVCVCVCRDLNRCWLQGGGADLRPHTTIGVLVLLYMCVLIPNSLEVAEEEAFHIET